MRKTLLAVVVAAALAVGTAAVASPAMPRPLERIVEDADLIVVGRIGTKPRHSGDEFTIDVEETLKGRAPGRTVRAKAAHYFVSCFPPEPGAPKPASLEGRATRAILFLDGDRQSSDPILLDPDEGASAWFGESRPAATAVGAIKALVALDAETDDARAADLWAAGLGGDDPLLASCLLLRIGFAARTTPGEDACHLGPRIGPRAKTQLQAARARLLPHLTRFVASEELPRRTDALWESYTCLYDGLFDAGEGRDALLAAVRAASRSADAKTRGIAVSCLAAARDPEAAERCLAALRARPFDRAAAADFEVVTGRTMLLRSYPEREAELLAAAAALLDEPGAEDVGAATLSRLTAQNLATIEAWREWWKKRTTK